MSNETIRIGVLGTGRIGRLHAEHLCWRVDGAHLGSVYDLNADAARATAKRCGDVAIAESIDGILEDPNIDAVLICTSTDTHSSLIERAARAGKHIFCEKPVDFDLGRIDAALAAVNEAGVKLQVGFNRRFDPNFSQVQGQVNAGNVGDVHLLKITSRDPAPPPIEYVKVSGGLFLDMTIHDFDMARFLVGSEVESVHAVGAVRVDPAIGEAGDIDTAIVTLKFENGAIGVIDNSRQAVYGYDQRVEVFGAGGMVWADNNTPHRTGLADSRGVHGPKPLHFFIERYVEAYVNELQAFVDCIRNDTPSPVDGNDGRAPVVIGLAAQRSLAEGRPVTLAEILES
jgi:myo-inositol 2-dehydrogenase/D-chiro-inositol 1-dehydrogenase